jgi:FKBP-type peptidyl-prolyl cis-trans isomerase
MLSAPAFALAQQQPGQGQTPPAGESSLKSVKERASYSIGVNIGNNFKRLGFDLDISLLAKGISDALSGAKPQLADKEMQEALETFQREATARQAEMAQKAAEKNKQEGIAFHAENKKKEGVTTLPSGLQYKVLKSGNGKSPKATDTVTTNYKGTLLDGTVFDSSYDRGEPASFPVNQVIKGWTEALQLMKVGDKWQLFIPSELGYGERGAGQAIGPNASLVFEIELLGIQPSDPASQK